MVSILEIDKEREGETHFFATRFFKKACAVGRLGAEKAKPVASEANCTPPARSRKMV